MEHGTRIAGRYRVEARLGRGGMGTVWRVHDEVLGRDVALKRMGTDLDGAQARRSAALFEREYHALAQLAHPRIIAVYDYGVADSAPYYTMELLDGKDLREHAPVAWKRACALLRDVCSSLSILHSRRIVHRDLSPRNVRCTADGRAKLIDFGAMSPMGAIDQVVGTPPYMSPEAVLGPDVDGRADLFALGALAYWTLTGRHAFPAKTIAELRQAWRSAPPAPSSYAPDVPRDLDELVMTLLSTDPLERPQSAAEVIERLTGIAGLEPMEQSGIAQAYLRTPTLVGREDELERFHRRLRRAQKGRGGTLLVEGGAGTGKTRLLNTFLLEGRLAGSLAVRVSAAELESGAFMLWRALGRALLEHAPELTRVAAEAQRAVLRQLMPEVLGARERATIEGYDPSGERVQRALVDFVVRIAKERCVILGVDDVESADGPSLSALARLAHEVRTHAILVVTTALSESGVPRARSIESIAATGGRLTLDRLSRQESGSLVGSLFGATPHLEVVASWMYGIARGNPGRTMELAQFLVDREVARFAEGSWSLPEQLHDQDLPVDMEQAMREKLLRLSAPATRLAQLLALVTPYGPLALGDYHALLAEKYETSTIFAALEELTRAQIVVRQGHALRGDAWRSVVLRGLSDERRRELHAELAPFYRSRRGGKLLQAYHRAQAGQWLEAIDALIEAGRDGVVTDVASAEAVFARSPYGVELMEQAIEAADRLGQLKGLGIILRRSLLGVAASARPDLVHHAPLQLEQLKHDSGLVYMNETDPRLGPEERLVECLRRAQRVYDATPPLQQGFRPEQAIRELALLASLLTGVYVRVLDIESLCTLPEVVAPLARLAKAADVLYRVTLVTRDVAVYGAQATDARLQLRAELAEPLEGVDDVLRQGVYHLYSFYVGIDCAVRADSRALEVADSLHANWTHAALPWQVRKLYYQSIGRRDRAEACRREMEVISAGHVEVETHLVVSLFFELGVAATTADLMEVKRLSRRFEREAEEHPGWRPVERLAASLYDLLRQDLASAEAAAREGLAGMQPVMHVAWLPLRSVLVEVLRRTGRAAEALRFAAESIAEFRKRGLAAPIGPFPPIEIAMALTEADLELRDEAQARLDGLLASLSGRAEGCILRGVVHEARARVALLAGERETFELHAEHAAAIYRASQMPSLARRYAALVSEARQRHPDYRCGLVGIARVPSSAADETPATITSADSDEATLRMGSDRAESTRR